MIDVFAFKPATNYRVVLIDGTQMIGSISKTFDNGIEIFGLCTKDEDLRPKAYRISQDKILYWNEL